MNFRSGAIQRQGDHLDISFLHLRADFVGNQSPVGRHAHTQTLISPIAGNLENIFAQQGFTAGQHHHRLADFADIVNQLKGLCGGKIPDRRIHIGGAAAMNAAQIAALGTLPGNPLWNIFFILACHMIL
jgi:hypothetical protein